MSWLEGGLAPHWGRRGREEKRPASPGKISGRIGRGSKEHVYSLNDPRRPRHPGLSAYMLPTTVSVVWQGAEETGFGLRLKDFQPHRFL